MVDFGIEKPDDWGINPKEKRLEELYERCKAFFENPTCETKERLIALTILCGHDPWITLGPFRLTSYESALINTLYQQFKLLNLRSGISFIYSLLREEAYYARWVSQALSESPFDRKYMYKGLFPQLQVFYNSLFAFFLGGTRSFVEQLISDFTLIENEPSIDIGKAAISINNLLYDLSTKLSFRCLPETNFTRDEIKKLFAKSSELMKRASYKQTITPHRSILCMALSNWVLSSRNEWRTRYLYKCITKKVVDASFKNGQIWMRKKVKT